MYLKYLLLLCVFVLDVVSVLGTRCKPLSFFKVDCLLCMCSSNGNEYVCENKKCSSVPNYDDFIKEVNKEGRIIYTPKSKRVLKFNPDDDFTYQKVSGPILSE